MIESVMFWNEPNNLSHWDYTLDPEWATFSQMIIWAAEAVKSANPAVKRVLGGISPIDPGFIQKLFGHGVGEWVDLIAVHGFPLDWNLWRIDEWPEKVAEIERECRHPVWVTEAGASSFGADEVQVFGLRRTAELLLNRVERVYWYSLLDLPRGRDATTRHLEAEGSAYYRHFHMGLVQENGQPKESIRHFPPEMGICQWVHLYDHATLEAVTHWLEKLGVKDLRIGLSWADSHVQGAFKWFDEMMWQLRHFRLMVTLCFTPPSRGIRPHHTSPPIDPGEFAYFCQQVVQRYS